MKVGSCCVKFSRLVGRSVGRLIGLLVGLVWFVGCLAGRSVSRFVGWLVGWLACLVVWFIVCLFVCVCLFACFVFLLACLLVCFVVWAGGCSFARFLSFVLLVVFGVLWVAAAGLIYCVGDKMLLCLVSFEFTVKHDSLLSKHIVRQLCL